MKSILLGVTISPMLQAILQISGLFSLTPLSHWGLDSSMITIFTYLVTIMSAAFACLLSARKNKDKILLLIGGMVVMVVLYTLYMRLANTPPSESFSWLYEVAAVVSFFGTYMTYGFSVGRVAEFYVTRSTRKQANTRTP